MGLAPVGGRFISRRIAFLLDGRESNREGIGARIRVQAAGRTQSASVKSATGYCSQNQLPVVFGLGSTEQVEKVEVLWPSGKKQELSDLAVRRTYTLTEP